MTLDDLDRLKDLCGRATRGPWFVQERSDNLCMSAIVVTTEPNPTPDYDFNMDGWKEHDVVAACLLQDGDYAALKDRKWHENADLIAEMRNALPELLRLARLGLKVEHAAA